MWAECRIPGVLNRGPSVAINMRPARGPWGGSSPFVAQLVAFLRRLGYRVGYRLDRDTDLAILIDPRADLANKSFDMRDILELKRVKPSLKILHRINECDKRKATSFMDRLLAEANIHADYTVFISDWLRRHHSESWFDQRRAHSVIYNGADIKDYNPLGKAAYQGGTLRVVTHHWSNNAMKGFDQYQKLDQDIAEGRIPDCKLVVIGRWPEEIHWKSAELHAPVTGRKLSALLKTCHAYITASVWEPCGMHHVEGAQCGLPVLYHRDGGGINEMCSRYGIEFTDETVAEGIEVLRAGYPEFEKKVLLGMPSGIDMCTGYLKAIQYLLAASA